VLPAGCRRETTLGTRVFANTTAWVVSGTLALAPREDGTPSRTGWYMQSFREEAPEANGLYLALDPPGSRTVSVSADFPAGFGVFANVVETATDEGPRFAAQVVRVLLDPANGAARAADARIAWEGAPRAEAAGGETRLDGRVRIENAGRRRLPAAAVAVFLSDDDVLDASDRRLVTFRARSVPGRRSVVVRLPADGVAAEGLAFSGRRLLAALDPDGKLPEAERDDDVAASAPLE
jgi:hypothetical protein